MAELGNKAKLEIGSPTKKIVGRLTSIGAFEQTVAKVDVSALEDNHKQYIPGGIIDTTDIAIEGLYKKGDEGQAAMVTAFTNKSIETFTITWSDGAKLEVKGFLTNLTLIGQATSDETLAFAATIAPSEAPTFTAAT
jgi:hypothetical protein